MTCHIEIRLFATLEKWMPENAGRYEIREGTTVGDLLALLHIPEEKARLIFVNGRKSGREERLHPGDRVGIFPPVGGG